MGYFDDHFDEIAAEQYEADQAAEAEEDSDEHGHRNGQGKKGRQQVADEAQNVDERSRAVYGEFHQREKIAHEQDEGEEHATQQSVANNLAKNITSEDAQVNAASMRLR